MLLGVAGGTTTEGGGAGKEEKMLHFVLNTQHSIDLLVNIRILLLGSQAEIF
jgi:hypothetical protein